MEEPIKGFQRRSRFLQAVFAVDDRGTIVCPQQKEPNPLAGVATDQFGQAAGALAAADLTRRIILGR